MSLIISIDLWGTLIKSSPSFQKAKVELTKEYFNVSEEHILKCYSETKKQLNDIIEITGFQPDSYTIFNLLFNKLNGKYGSFSRDFFYNFEYKYQGLALEIMPEIYSPETIVYLRELSEIGKIRISSNTMMISGGSLKKIIQKLNIGEFFEQTLFSDILNIAKPSRQMFGNSNFHIGDNELTDGIGAVNANSVPIIINTNTQTIKDAYHIIAQSR